MSKRVCPKCGVDAAIGRCQACGDTLTTPGRDVCQNCGEPIISPKQPSLLPCPSCGGEAHHIDDGIGCKDICRCDMRGPVGDPTGSKWNSLPRYTEDDAMLAATSWTEGKDGERQRWISAVRFQRDTAAAPAWIGACESILEDMGVRNE